MVAKDKKNQDQEKEEEKEEQCDNNDEVDDEGGDEVGDEEEEDDEKDLDESKDEKVDEKEDKKIDIDELLKEKIKLDDGSEHLIYSRGPKYSDGSWPLNCHLCRMPLFNDDQIKNHIIGRRHNKRLTRFKPTARLLKEPFFQVAPKNLKDEADKQIKIYPGEVIAEITPEYEDRVIKGEEFEIKLPANPKVVEELQAKESLHDYNEKLPLFGLCYVYKMYGKGGLIYFCTLCNKRIPKSGLEHVTSSRHQIKYIMRHFPNFHVKVTSKLDKERGNIKYDQCIRDIFRKLYRKIEEDQGFRKVTIVDDDYFFDNLKKFALKTRFDSHYDETTIPITEEEVDELIQKCIDKEEFIKPDDIPESERIERRPRERRGDRDRDRDRYRGRDRSPPRKRRYNDYDSYEWRRYHEIIRREIEDLNEQYREYDRNPRSHPRYVPKENSFFRARRREGQAIEDIRREFQQVWKKSLRGFYDLALKKRKFQVKMMLRLPDDVRTPSPSPPRTMRSSYDYDRRMYGDRYSDRRDMDMIEPPIMPQVPQQPLGVVSCLRLLTALEEQLGSLGPKAVQLLSRAVLTEKSGKNPNDLLMENDFYIFFVTAKEKLQGKLFANILDHTQTVAVTRACEYLNNLLEMFEEYMKAQGKSMPLAAMGLDDEMKGDGGGGRFGSQYDSMNNGGGLFKSNGSGDNYSGRGGGGRSGNSGGVWQTGGSTSSSQIPPPLVSYPDRPGNNW